MWEDDSGPWSHPCYISSDFEALLELLSYCIQAQNAMDSIFIFLLAFDFIGDSLLETILSLATVLLKVL